MASIKDYPKYITENAQKAKNWVDKNGYGSCMTPVGKARLNQLAKGEPISLDTIKRMKAYADRHKKDLSSSKGFDDGCGYLAWFSWGLDETGRVEKWLESKIKSMEKFNEDVSGLSPYVDEVSGELVRKPVLASLPLFESKDDAEAMAIAIGCKGSHPHQYGDKTLYMPCESHNEDMGSLDDACWPGYEAIGMKDDGTGKMVPNCVPIAEKQSAQFNSYNEDTTFSVFNAEQRLVVGPAMIPDKMIIRRNEITGEIYYVYFTAETIKKLQQKFMQEKLLGQTNIEHGRRFLDNVDVVESWIVEDPQYDKERVFGMDYPKGTWMISMKVNDDDTWNKVKDGKLKGFSVQGYFLEKAKFGAVSNEVLNEIKEILKQIK
jgi:hypothetical protein